MAFADCAHSCAFSRMDSMVLDICAIKGALMASDCVRMPASMANKAVLR